MILFNTIWYYMEKHWYISGKSHAKWANNIPEIVYVTSKMKKNRTVNWSREFWFHFLQESKVEKEPAPLKQADVVQTGVK